MSEPQTPVTEVPVALQETEIARVDPEVIDLRGHTARGTLVNSAFQVGIAGLALVQRLAAAAFLTTEEVGLWGIVLTILVTLAWLKQLGIPDKFIQQSEPDQEAEFQRAFTLELGASLAFFAIAAVAMPLYALAYGQPEIVAAGLVCALAVPISVLQAPAWVPYRRLQYVRHRTLVSIDPVVSFVVTIVLAVAGVGYWAFVIGVVAGAVAGAVACVATSAYRLRLRFERASARAYVSFSWPLLAAGLTQLVVVQGSLLVADGEVGLAGIGAIGLAVGIAAFADRVDAIVSQTIYPAVCAVADRTEVLFEVFVKSNRLALMWAMPVGAGLGLFADDLITFAFGPEWEAAILLVAAFGVTSAIGQLAFNWTVFVRATGNTKPLLAAALLDLACFGAVWVPAILAFGLEGWALAFAVTTVAHLFLRAFFLRRLFAGFRIVRQLVRAIAPTVPPVLVVLAIRVLDPGGRSPLRAALELALYAVVAVAATLLIERRLVLEVVGYLRRGR